MDVQELIRIAKQSEKEPTYPKRIATLKSRGWDSSLIEKGISECVRELENNTKSFVVYGEPQSGKTEFMIALTCKLIDMGFETVFVVMNDNVELETQNFDRFHSAQELSATPIRDYQLSSYTDKELKFNKPRVIFCRKNKKNLEKLIHLCRFMKKRIVIDDEADFATPNSKINKADVTAINEAVGTLGDLERHEKGFHIDGEGTYIGVTATPARLDLNNTFLNDSKRWVFLDSHEKYKGRAFFFPVTDEDKEKSDFNLVMLPNEGDDPKYLRYAVYRFLTRVTLLNYGSGNDVHAHSMLIHTAGNTNDHEEDQKGLQRIITALSNPDDSKFELYCKELAEVITKLLLQYESASTLQEVFSFILRNIGKHEILVINHKNDSANVKRAGQPNALFTFAIGGNIVSRGLTFDNLLTFFFSRNVKGRLQQNTYIQRARMFGNRPYSKYFELCVPEQLYNDWADCFNDHELSLRLAKAKVYQHIQSGRTSVVDAGARDKANVTMDKAERVVGDVFELTHDLINAFLSEEANKPLTLFQSLLEKEMLSDLQIPPALLEYVSELSNEDESNVVLITKENGLVSLEGYADADKLTITRPRGGLIQSTINKRRQFKTGDHLFMPVTNGLGQARIYYKSNLGHTILQNLHVKKPITI